MERSFPRGIKKRSGMSRASEGETEMRGLVVGDEAPDGAIIHRIRWMEAERGNARVSDGRCEAARAGVEAEHRVKRGLDGVPMPHDEELYVV